MPVIKLPIKRPPKISYDIIIEKGCIKTLPAYLKKEKPGKKYAIITDNTVRKLFGNGLKKMLNKAGIQAELFDMKSGEKSKNLKTVEKLAQEMVEKGFSRHDAVIALGGGVVGDTAGFLASIFMRGVPVIHIPTTLLGMVDSAIGGKTGVDLSSGKNLIGSIYQPKAIFIDYNYIKNLPPKQLKNGLAEIIKYGVIMDKSLFKFIERNIEGILNNEEKLMTHLIEKSVRCKVKVVKRDEKEHGIRIILNYGHTYGHAIEKRSGYKTLHGYAISVGMVIANQIAVKKKVLKKKTAERIKNLLKQAGLPVATLHYPDKKDIASDKKREGNYIKMVIPEKIGKVIIHKEKCV